MVSASSFLFLATGDCCYCCCEQGSVLEELVVIVPSIPRGFVAGRLDGVLSVAFLSAFSVKCRSRPWSRDALLPVTCLPRAGWPGVWGRAPAMLEDVRSRGSRLDPHVLSEARELTAALWWTYPTQVWDPQRSQDGSPPNIHPGDRASKLRTLTGFILH